MIDNKKLLLIAIGIGAYLYAKKASATAVKAPSANAVPYNYANPYNNPYLPGYVAPGQAPAQANPIAQLGNLVSGIFGGLQSAMPGINTGMSTSGPWVPPTDVNEGNAGEAAAANYFASFPDQFAVNAPSTYNTNPAAYVSTGGFLDSQ